MGNKAGIEDNILGKAEGQHTKGPSTKMVCNKDTDKSMDRMDVRGCSTNSKACMT